MKELFGQLIKFGFVGIITFLIDYGILLVLTEEFQVHYLLSSGFSFTIALVVNFILSIRYVFKNSSINNKKILFLLFAVLSILGLGINQVVMWYCVDRLKLHYSISKIIATAIVMIYNFASRKILIEK